jgi:hypothetical protein
MNAGGDVLDGEPLAGDSTVCDEGHGMYHTVVLIR